MAVRQRTRELMLTDEATDVLAAVQEKPVCNLSDTRQRTGLGRHVFAAALDALVEAGLVHRLVTGSGVLLLPDQPGIRECLQHLRALWDPRTRMLHAFLHDDEVHARQDVVEQVAQWGWSEDAARWHLRCLEESGLLQAVMDVRDPRCIMYRYLPAHPLVHELLGQEHT